VQHEDELVAQILNVAGKSGAALADSPGFFSKTGKYDLDVKPLR